MDNHYSGLTPEQVDNARKYAQSHELAFEWGDGYVTALPADPDAPAWTGEHIRALEAILGLV